MRHPVVRPIPRVQMYKIVLLPASNNRTHPLGNRTIFPLLLRIDCDTLMTPVRVELGPSHFCLRAERDHNPNRVLLKHNEKILAS